MTPLSRLQLLQQELLGYERAVSHAQAQLERARKETQKRKTKRENEGTTRNAKKKLRWNVMQGQTAVANKELHFQSLLQSLNFCRNQLRVMEAAVGLGGLGAGLDEMFEEQVVRPCRESEQLEGLEIQGSLSAVDDALALAPERAAAPRKTLNPAAKSFELTPASAQAPPTRAPPTQSPPPPAPLAQSQSSTKTTPPETSRGPGPEIDLPIIIRGRRHHQRRPSETAIELIEYRLKHQDPMPKKLMHRKTRTLDSWTPLASPVSVWGQRTEEEDTDLKKAEHKSPRGGERAVPSIVYEHVEDGYDEAAEVYHTARNTPEI